MANTIDTQTASDDDDDDGDLKKKKSRLGFVVCFLVFDGKYCS